MPRPASLEAFELIQGGAKNEPSKEWIAGHAAGLAEAAAQAESDQANLTEQLAQTLADMAFGFHEARAHMLTTLVPMFTQLIDALVPRLAQEMLVPHIAGQLADTAGAAISSPIVITLHPDHANLVTTSLAQLKDSPFTLHTDPALSRGQAIITQDANERLLDLDAMVSQLQTILANLIDVSQQRLNHG